MKKCFIALFLSFSLLISSSVLAAPTWIFDDPDEIAGWSAINQCDVVVEGGVLKIESTGTDPYIFPGGEWNTADWEPFSGGTNSTIYMSLKLNVASTWQVYYTTEENGAWGEDQRQNFDLEASADFVDVALVMERGGWQENTVNHFRIDPGTEAGVISEIDYISLESQLAPVNIKGKLPVLWSELRR